MAVSNRTNIADEIKSRCNIVDVIGRVVTLKKAGSNYKGLCPFHNEKTPSFVVSEQKQIYTCFGCGATGDVISFVERYYNLDFRGAVEQLAKEYGIELTGAFASNGDKDELYEINRQAARFFYKALRKEDNPAYRYMRGRGISNETLNQFGIGYADDEWTSLTDHLTGMGFEPQKLVELGLCSVSKGRYYDKFRGRVIFPIQNTRGKVIGFGGRVLGDGMPKYLNSSESPVFLKKNNLYGLNLSKDAVVKENEIILVEGYMDVISVYQAGVRNVSASLGTALTENQARLIKRYTKNVVLSYDADDAGQMAAMRGVDILYGEDCKARVLVVSDGKDPDEFIKQHGRQAFLDLVKEAVPYGDFKLNYVKRKYDMDDEQQRIDFLGEAVDILKKMKPVEADIYIKKLSEEYGISERAIRMEYQSENDSGTSSQRIRIHKEQTEKATHNVERTLLKLMLLDEKYEQIPEDVQSLLFKGPAEEAIRRRIQECAGMERPFSMAKLCEELDEDVAAELLQIDEMPVSADKEDEIFHDCIRFVRLEELKRRDEELTSILSIADESTPEEILVKYMEEKIEIQKKINGLGGRS